jgi:CheY-like chemotaxis protein
VLLDRLKHDARTRHIPVHVISAANGEEGRALQFGARGVLQKPPEKADITGTLTAMRDFLERNVKRLLIVCAEESRRQGIVELIGDSDITITAVDSPGQALQALREQEPFDCVVLDVLLGLELARLLQDNAQYRRLPILVYREDEPLSAEFKDELRKFGNSMLIKDVSTAESLLNETARFLHRVESNLPDSKRKMLRSLAQGDPALRGKKILVVDDDIRNIFAITAVLEGHAIDVLYAENGQQALEMLSEHRDVNAVLMDIMMPEMDGYEATRRIRQREDKKNLPVIALTAKAMKGDRKKCIDAGASDYITKPVDPDQLISLLRVWLHAA